MLEFITYSPNQCLIGTSVTSMLFFICCTLVMSPVILGFWWKLVVGNNCCNILFFFSSEWWCRLCKSCAKDRDWTELVLKCRRYTFQIHLERYTTALHGCGYLGTGNLIGFNSLFDTNRLSWRQVFPRCHVHCTGNLTTHQPYNWQTYNSGENIHKENAKANPQGIQTGHS